MSFRAQAVFCRPKLQLFEPIRGISLKDKRFAEALMHQQCWCWGQDIRARENLLMRFGSVRARDPQQKGASRYELTLDDGAQLALWAFGLWLKLPRGGQGFISRGQRGVWLLPDGFTPTGVHDERAITPHLRRPASGEGLRIARMIALRAAEWCEAYERWVVESEGLDHRRASLREWEDPVVPAEQMPSAWRRVEAIYQRWYGNKCARITNPPAMVARLSMDTLG